MGFFADIFGLSPKPTPPGVTIRNVLGEVIDRVEGVWRLEHADLRGRQWPFADLSGVSLDDVNLEGANLFGAKLFRTSFCRANLKNADLSYSFVESANFREANLDNADLLHTNIKLSQLDGAIVTPTSTIPGIKVVA